MPRSAPWTALLLAGAGWLWGAASLPADWADYRARGLDGLLAMQLAGVLGAAAGLTWALRSSRAKRAGGLPWERPSAATVRRIAACLGAALVATSLADAMGWLRDSAFAESRCFGAVLLAGLCLWALGDTARSGTAEPESRGVLALLDRLAAAALLVLVLLEAGLAAWTHTGLAGPLFDPEDAAERIAAWRLPPGRSWLGSPVNSGGYPDDEFFAATERDYVVALIADSFGVGVVPRPQHFATLIEQQLAAALDGRYARVAVHDFGVSSIGMPEYRWLLDNAVLDLAPRRVVLCVFVGNDILDAPRRRGRYTLREWRVWKTSSRLWRLAKARQLPTPRAAAAPLEPIDAGLTHFDEEAFLRIETDRLRVLEVGDDRVERRWKRFEHELAAIHARAGERLLVVVIPDEFQVNDALWSTLSARANGTARLDRALPQRRIAAFCTERHIECLDLLGPLRAAEAGGATYRPRDTHWNERGNRVAAAEISASLRRAP